jgi:hypothetical protein
VRDVAPGEPEDPRIALEWAVGELRQLAVVVRRQVVADLAQLLVDDVEVVDQPFGGGRDGALILDGTREDAVRLEEQPAVLPDAPPNGVATARRVRDGLGGGERLRVLLQPLDAEELREDGFVAFDREAGASLQGTAAAGSAWDLVMSAFGARPDGCRARGHGFGDVHDRRRSRAEPSRARAEVDFGRRIRMLISMRTTLVLDDQLLRRARKRAAEDGTTLSELVNDALRDALREKQSPQRPFRLITFGGTDGAVPREPSDFKTIIEDEDAARMG